MTRDEIKTIASIVEGDNTYRHFVNRINKEFDAADDNRNARVQVLFKDLNDNHIGFSVIGVSSAKMKVWNEMFIEEGWVDRAYKIDPNAFELMYMYIRPEFRGKGMGKALLTEAFDFAKQESVSDVYAYVSDRTPNSLEFYRKMNANVIQDFSDEDITSAFIHWGLK